MAVFSAIAYGIGYAVGFLGAAAGLSTTTILSLATAATQVATSLALNAVAQALAPKPNIPQQEIQAIINQTDAPRRVYVGQYLAGGIRAFFDVKGSILYQLVLVNHGRITGFEEFRIDGEPVALDGVDVVGSKEEGSVFVATHNGSGNGGDYSALRDNFPEVWGPSRRLEGQATFLVRAKAPWQDEFSKVFPKGYNTTFQWVIRGQAIYDPRAGNTAYRDNAALVEAHYLTHPDGFKLPSESIDWDSVSAMAAVCDLPVEQLSGNIAPNFRLWGYWTLDEEPNQVLARMETSSGIRPYEMQDGRIGLIGGPFGQPACTLTAKDISEIRTSEAISEREGYNVLRVFYLSPTQKYEVFEAKSWRDESRLAQEGEIVQEFRAEMSPNRSQARRLAKRRMHDDNRQKVEIITNLVGLKARWPRYHGQRHTILLDYRPEDGSGRVIQGEYEVLDHEFDPVDLKCRIELGRVDRASQAWTAAEEGEGTDPLPDMPGDLAPPLVAAFSQRVINISAGTRQAILEVSAVPIPDRDDLGLTAQFRKVGEADWTDMTATDLRAQSPAVEDGSQYEARARWIGVFEGLAPWVMLGPITVQIDATAPGAPTELMPGGSSGSITWRNPTTGFYEIRVYRGTTTNLAEATLNGQVTGGASGQISEYQDTTAPSGTNYYWVRAANVSGVEGPAAGPATITI